MSLMINPRFKTRVVLVVRCSVYFIGFKKQPSILYYWLLLTESQILKTRIYGFEKHRRYATEREKVKAEEDPRSLVSLGLVDRCTSVGSRHNRPSFSIGYYLSSLRFSKLASMDSKSTQKYATWKSKGERRRCRRASYVQIHLIVQIKKKFLLQK